MSPPKRKIRIDFSQKFCKQCGICIRFCPEQVYEWREGYPAVTEIDKCTGCLQCEMRCPDFAIEVHVSKEDSHD